MRLRSRLVRPAPSEWQQALDRLKTRIRVSRPVRLLVSSLVQAPAVVGWLRPVVLVPVGALAGLPAEQIEALLVHELAHIRRHDYLVNVLQSVVEALLFYHPAVWWVSGHIRTEREQCCDDVAVSVSGDVLTYARALAEIGIGASGPFQGCDGRERRFAGAPHRQVVGAVTPRFSALFPGRESWPPQCSWASLRLLYLASRRPGRNLKLRPSSRRRSSVS